MSDCKNKEFGLHIAALMRGENLDRATAREMFRQVLMDEQSGLQQGAFLAALTAKGETAEEIAGAWEAVYELDTAKVELDLPAPLVENSGTGMDSFKTFNISTAAAIIAAAGGVYMARHGARAITSACGTVDMLESLGVDVECEVAVVKNSIEKAGIGLFNGMSARVHPNALFRILSQINFGTTFNIAGSLANPAMPRYGLRGVYSQKMLTPALQVMREIGYQRAMVVYGTDSAGQGMDELSTLGQTFIAELRPDGSTVSYSVLPEDFGICRPSPQELRPEADRQEEALRFVELISGRKRTARAEIVCLNAAPLFLLTGKARDLKDGYEMAIAILSSGRAMSKLEQWVSVQNRDAAAGRRKLAGLVGAM
jgi:anthranilate phosphoribosyltransferase